MPARCCASPTPIRRFIGGQMWVAMDPPTARSGAAGRHPQHPRLLDPRRSRRSIASSARQQGEHSRRRILPHAGRVHPHARAASDPKEAWCAVRRSARRSKAISISPRTTCACAARSFRSTAQQRVRADPDRRAVPRRQQRRPARHHLRGGRPAERAGPARQSDLGGGAGLAAQVLRIPERRRPAERIRARPATANTR